MLGTDTYSFDTWRSNISATYRYASERNYVHLYVVAPPADRTWFDVYRDALPAQMRGQHTCPDCARFINEFGGIVQIEENGQPRSLLWRKGSAEYTNFADPVTALRTAVESSNVVDVWSIDTARTWLVEPTTDHVHTHLNCTAPLNRVHTAAERQSWRAQYDALLDLMGRYNADQLRRAVEVLSDNSYAPDDHPLRNQITALQVMHTGYHATRLHRKKTGLLWRNADMGLYDWTIFNTTKLAALLAEIAAGVALPDLLQHWECDMNPAQYPLRAAAIAQERVDELLDQFNLRPSLERRYAHLSEVPTIWTPHYILGQSNFDTGHFPARRTRAPQQLSWTAFAARLPEFIRIVHYNTPADYCAIVTARDPHSAPLLRWDQPECRNPFNWYSYAKPAQPERWNVPNGYSTDVRAIVLRPSLWYDPQAFADLEPGVLFCLNNCYDTKPISLGLFADTLHPDFAELHPWLVEYSRTHRLDVPEDRYLTAAGVRLVPGKSVKLYCYTLHTVEEITVGPDW